MYKIENIMFSEVAGDSPPPLTSGELPHSRLPPGRLSPGEVPTGIILPQKIAYLYISPQRRKKCATTAIKSCSNIRLLLSFIFQRLEKDQNLGLQI